MGEQQKGDQGKQEVYGSFGSSSAQHKAQSGGKGDEAKKGKGMFSFGDDDSSSEDEHSDGDGMKG